MKSRLLGLAFVILPVFMLINPRYPGRIPATPSDAAPSSALAAGHGCTSFCLNNAGHGVFGANLDENFNEGYLYINQRQVSKTGLEPNASGEYARWVSKYGSLTFNLVAYQLAWAGMNEAGLMISTMALPETVVPDADARPPLQSPFWIQYQLDNYSSIEEVIASEPLVRIAPGARDHFLVCDSSGDCVAIEILGGKMVYHTVEKLPVAALTNTDYAASVKAWQAGSLPDSPFNSLKRFGTAADRVKGFEAMSSESAVQYAFDTLFQVRNPGLTAWSIVFDAQNQRAYFRTVENEEIRYVDFSKLDFSCGKSVQMLNIHEGLSGDVSDKFVPYSHELSLAHTKKSFPQFGIFIPDEWVEKFVGQMESFSCTKAEEKPTQAAPLVKVEEQPTKGPTPVKVEGESTQVTSLVKVEEEPTQIPPPVKAGEGIAKETPRNLILIGSLAVAVPVIGLFLVLYGIRRRKG